MGMFFQFWWGRWKYACGAIFLLQWMMVAGAQGEGFLGVNEIKPGMRGKTMTVMEGTEVVALETEIKGVAWDFLGPGRHLIIGRLVDEKTMVTGAVHGMSGSPLYVDGKLVGALSRRLAFFEKDGHCGFTPIADMLDVVERGVDERPEGVMGRKAESLEVGEASLFTIPLEVSGWKAGWEPYFQEVLDGLGASGIPLGGDFHFAGVVGGGNAGARGKRGQGKAAGDFPMVPGSPLVGILATGDIRVGATGTLTYVDGDRVVGFGHPMVGIGDVEMGLGGAEIITVIPSYQRPYKLSNQGGLRGVMRQDRLSAVAGVLGKYPDMASYVFERVHDGKAKDVLRGEFVTDYKLAPMTMLSLLVRAFFDNQDVGRSPGMKVSGEIQFSGFSTLEVNGYYGGGMDGRVAAVLDQLRMLGGFYGLFEEQLKVESLKLKVESFEESDVWGIHRVRVLSPEVYGGAKIMVRVELRNKSGGEQVKDFRVAVPESFKGEGLGEREFMLRVMGGGRAEDREEKLRLALNREVKVEELIRAMNEDFQQDVLYVEVVTRDSGVIFGDEVQSGVPTSVLDVFVTDGGAKKSGRLLREKVWGREVVELGQYVEGEQHVLVKVSRKGL